MKLYFIITVLFTTGSLLAQISSKQVSIKLPAVQKMANEKSRPTTFYGEAEKPESLQQYIPENPKFNIKMQLENIKMIMDMGGVNGGGGDEDGLNFEVLLKRALNEISQIDPANYTKISDRKIEDYLSTFKVIVVEKKLHVTSSNSLQESAAKNYPEARLILLNRERWKNITSENLKKALALHEFLSLMGLEKTGSYKYSSNYLKLLKVNEAEFYKLLDERKQIVTTYQKNPAETYLETLTYGMKSGMNDYDLKTGNMYHEHRERIKIRLSCQEFDFLYLPEVGDFTVLKSDPDKDYQKFMTEFRLISITQNEKGDIYVYAKLGEGEFFSYDGYYAYFDFKIYEITKNKPIQYNLNLTIENLDTDSNKDFEYKKSFTCTVLNK